ncbi:histidine kinase [Anaerocolumna sp. AGMB13020]|uniref:sensor histidine kinase n=1 Tax=Anaerocolumna sp. AGMB13020 TaxID=3081750 RepID=UPI002953CCB5|nr:histidine kinase [Anaerocolumna sp. AGMB13020]WOO34720.1 histidine kinase [Anaerocolumna sp. AGMB13020]
MWVLTLILGISILIAIYYKMNHTDVFVVKGTVDAEESMPSGRKILPLNGEWEFYWGQLLEPEDFKKEVRVHSYMMVPGSWRKDIDGKKYPDYGYATYRITLTKVNPGVIYGLKKQSIRIASKIYVNGKLLIQNGSVSDSVRGENMGNMPEAVYFQSDEDKIEIIIQVSSHKIFGGGIAEAIYFGEQQEITSFGARNIVRDMLPIAFSFGVAAVYLIIVLVSPGYYKKEKASVFFPMGAASLALINGTLGERIIKYILPGISAEGLLNLESVLISMGILSIVMAVYHLDRKFISTQYRNIVILIQGLFAILYVVLPAETPGIRTVFIIIDLLIIIAVEFRVLYLFMKRTELRISGIEHGLLLLVLYFIDVYCIDQLVFTKGLIGNDMMSLTASVLYITVWVFLLTYRYHVMYKKNEELTVALLESNYNMERVTNHAERSEIAFLQAQIKPHFLFNSLNSILSLCYSNPEKASELLWHLAEFLKSAFNIDMTSEFIRVESELESIRSYVFIEKTRFGKRLKVEMEIEEALKHQRIVPLLIQPLVENAIRHGALKREEGGNVRLSIQKEEGFGVVTVYDNGPGFSPNSLATLSGKAGDTETERKGVGIGNIKKRLMHYYGEELHIEEQEEGVKVWFRFHLEEEDGHVKGSNCR